MLYLMILSLIMFLMGGILTLISFMISNKSFFDREKESPFECGFDPLTPNRLPFSLRFFIITVIFLVFDVEIVLLLPMSSSFLMSNINYWIFTYLGFLLILLVGVIYEWNLGALYWKM